MSKMIKSRIQNKHDTEENWLKADNFTPLIGELIVYDPDDNNPSPKIKIGDGETNVNELPFIDLHYTYDTIVENYDQGIQSFSYTLTSSYTKIYCKHMGLYDRVTITAPDGRYIVYASDTSLYLNDYIVFPDVLDLWTVTEGTALSYHELWEKDNTFSLEANSDWAEHVFAIADLDKDIRDIKAKIAFNYKDLDDLIKQEENTRKAQDISLGSKISEVTAAANKTQE